MKKTLLYTALGISILFGAEKSFAQSADFGKTYYDAEKTRPKEVYSFKETTSIDPNNAAAPKTSVKKKHGPYFYYYETGKLKISGQYMNDQKSGDWKYYDDKGGMAKLEHYVNGQVSEGK